ncbi:MAG: glycosyltransferase family 2 protein [Bacteroidales bacterium]|jgi:glycosyltransferase involved in cell wall biosynthesis|nr:glycosyltransferase family 2 protein [Bacteroidales bacterium]
MKEIPLVSVIIPTYSRAKYLCTAIDSVLAQTYPNIEIIVIDDNGKGTENQLKTFEAVQEYLDNPNFYYLVHDVNKNGAVARNTGIRHSKGEYICFLDDDDEYLPKKVEKQVNIMENLEDKTWGGCYCNSYDYYSKKKYYITPNTLSGNLCAELLLGKAFIGSCLIMIKRDICIELNGFNENFKRHQDWEFLVRFFRSYKLKLIPEALIKYNYYLDGGNRLKTDKLLEVENMFLQTYRQDIINTGYGNDIFQKFLFDVAISFLRNSEYKKGCQILYKSTKFKSLTINQIKFVSKAIIKSLIF